MHVLIVGGEGQLGRALHTIYAQRSEDQVTIWDRPGQDISQPAIADALHSLQPDIVINTAAWTNVDAAEEQPDTAYTVNALGPKYLAEGCRRCRALLVQISTNEVFPGAPGHIYREYDLPRAGSVYARSKLAGERAVQLHAERWQIVRIAWLFGAAQGNFPTKIMDAADRLGALRVVADEFGNPTYAPDAAAAIVQVADIGRSGIYHLTNDGATSRFAFAEAVLQASGRGHIPLTPISAHEWPRPSQPPLHAVLANQTAAALGIRLRPWQEAITDFIAGLPADQTTPG